MLGFQTSILRRVISDEKFQQLCQLWQQTAQATDAVLVTETDLLPRKLRKNQQQLPPSFRLLACQQFGALLQRDPSLQKSGYEITLTFSQSAIATFLTSLERQFQHDPTVVDRLQQIRAIKLPQEGNLPNLFVLQLLEILAVETITNNQEQFKPSREQKSAFTLYQKLASRQLQRQKQALEIQLNQCNRQLQKALFAAQAAQQSKSEFISNMSHELRTPLTHIIGLSGTLLHWFQRGTSLPKKKQQQYIQTIHDSGILLLELINKILDFSSVEAGKSLLELSQFSLEDLAKSMLQNFTQLAQRQKIDLKLDFQIEAEGDRLVADQDKVAQILFQLLDNAIKFTPAHQTVTLRIWRENKAAVFQVEDRGIGISPEQIPLLFETFEQLEPSRQRTHSGAGLGLALTKRLIELHKGKIKVESVLQQGSSFTVWLPSQE